LATISTGFRNLSVPAGNGDYAVHQEVGAVAIVITHPPSPSLMHKGRGARG